MKKRTKTTYTNHTIRQSADRIPRNERTTVSSQHIYIGGTYLHKKKEIKEHIKETIFTRNPEIKIREKDRKTLGIEEK